MKMIKEENFNPSKVIKYINKFMEYYIKIDKQSEKLEFLMHDLKRDRFLHTQKQIK